MVQTRICTGCGRVHLNFGVNIKNLSERVISQYMFTQDKDYYDKLTQVFTDYYNKGASQLIAKAYIAYNSFYIY